MPAEHGKPPHNVNVLMRWVNEHAKATDVGRNRLQHWISYMIVAPALDRVRDEDDDPVFALKGGVAMELRLGLKARATTDYDAASRAQRRHARAPRRGTHRRLRRFRDHRRPAPAHREHWRGPTRREARIPKTSVGHGQARDLPDGRRLGPGDRTRARGPTWPVRAAWARGCPLRRGPLSAARSAAHQW
jgi:hypothetical protein